MWDEAGEGRRWRSRHAVPARQGLGGTPPSPGGMAQEREQSWDGQLWGESEPGYALLTVTPKRLHVVFKNDQGRELYTWSLDRETSPTQGQD